MSTYVYKDTLKGFEIDIVELRSGVRVALTDKGVTTQLCSVKSLAAAFEYVGALFTSGGRPAPLASEWKQL